MAESPYHMTLSLNLLNHLGINANRLYKQYLKKREETGRIQQLLNSIDKAELPE